MNRKEKTHRKEIVIITKSTKEVKEKAIEVTLWEAANKLRGSVVDNPVAIGFFVTFGACIYFRLTLFSITTFSRKIIVKISSGSWSFLFFLLKPIKKFHQK